MEKEYLQNFITKYYEKSKMLADYLTTHPELSGEEEKSCLYIVDFLKKEGYEVETPYAKMPHSFIARKKNKEGIKKDRKAAFLCEYDALPEVGHACGHSYSCGVSILAALALNDAYEDNPVQIDIIGTPGEETVGGKVIMADNGAFDNYEYVAMVHMNNEDNAHFNVLASNDRFITFEGRSAHASASPEKGLNALNAARLFMDAMDMWRQHLTRDCQIHGIIVHGGDAPNIVPDKVTLDYYFRADSLKKLYDINEKARLAMEGAALATGTKCHMEQRYPDYGEIFSNEYKEKFINELFENIGRVGKSVNEPMGSTDIGSIDVKIPVFHIMLDIANGDKSISLHNKAFEELLYTENAAKGLRDGAMILMKLAYRLATEEDTYNRIKQDHAKYRGLN